MPSNDKFWLTITITDILYIVNYEYILNDCPIMRVGLCDRLKKRGG